MARATSARSRGSVVYGRRCSAPGSRSRNFGRRATAENARVVAGRLIVSPSPAPRAAAAAPQCARRGAAHREDDRRVDAWIAEAAVERSRKCGDAAEADVGRLVHEVGLVGAARVGRALERKGGGGDHGAGTRPGVERRRVGGRIDGEPVREDNELGTCGCRRPATRRPGRARRGARERRSRPYAARIASSSSSRESGGGAGGGAGGSPSSGVSRSRNP